MQRLVFDVPAFADDLDVLTDRFEIEHPTASLGRALVRLRWRVEGTLASALGGEWQVAASALSAAATCHARAVLPVGARATYETELEIDTADLASRGISQYRVAVSIVHMAHGRPSAISGYGVSETVPLRP